MLIEGGVTKLLQPLPINWTNKKDWFYLLLQWTRDEERRFIRVDVAINSGFCWAKLVLTLMVLVAGLVTTNKAEAPDYLRFFFSVGRADLVH